MKERPILFSGPMVRAILEGRKTQTRRIVKPQPVETEWRRIARPYGQPGDRLWVKETWRTRREWNRIAPRNLPLSDDERADLDFARGQHITYAVQDDQPVKLTGKTRQSIFMMQWMSRLTLEIVRVRVERLQDITEEDAIAEGVTIIESVDHGKQSARGQFALLWESINGAGSWALNPWVWVVEFRKVENTSPRPSPHAAHAEREGLAQ